jgi:hypothetical protein
MYIRQENFRDGAQESEDTNRINYEQLYAAFMLNALFDIYVGSVIFNTDAF